MLVHIEQHLANDLLPSIREYVITRGYSTSILLSRDDRVVFFCPMGTCASLPYAQKGSTNRSHIVKHIKKHIGEPVNGYPKQRKRGKSHDDRDVGDEEEEKEEEEEE